MKLRKLEGESKFKMPMISYSSTKLDQEETDKLLRCGFDEFLEKPA